ncbi:MAG: tetratricopeptide repeat protein [Gemmataceae bacterium]
MTAKTRKQQIEELLALDPNDSFLRYGLAMEHVSAGDDEGALRVFRELITHDPDYVPAYLMAGQTLLRQGEEEEARTILKTGIVAANRNGNSHAAGEMTGLLGTLGG